MPGSPVGVYPEGPLRRGWRWVKRHRVALIAERPAFASAYLLRAPIYIARGALSLGLADLDAVLKLSDSARATYTESLTLDPADLRVHITPGWALVKVRRYPDARADFDAALQADPTNVEAHSGLGYARACERSYNEAHQEAAAALLYGADDYLILHNVACIYAEISRTQPAAATELRDRAIATLRRAIEIWREGGSGPDELDLIRQEPAFPPALRDRREFVRLLNAVAD